MPWYISSKNLTDKAPHKLTVLQSEILYLICIQAISRSAPCLRSGNEKIEKFGKFEIVPKKGYFILRRKKQFAMIGPGIKGRLEIGLNIKGVDGTARLEALLPGGMCQHRAFSL